MQPIAAQPRSYLGGARHRRIARGMKDRESHSGPYITLDTQTRRLTLVDARGNVVPVAERKAYIERMTLAELRTLIESLFDLPVTAFLRNGPAAH